MVEAALSASLHPEVQLALFRLSIQSCGNSAPTSPFTILLSAFLVLVQRLTGDDDISVGTSSENGDPFVLRSTVTPSEPFINLLSRVQQVPALLYALSY
jgi:L-2-aminoadipate reductase